MSFTDAISRVSEIQQQISALTTPAAAISAAAGSATAGSGLSATSTAATSSTQFASALAQAQLTGASATSAGDGAETDDALTAELAATAGTATTPTAADATGGSGLATGSTGTLPAGAASRLTSGQQQFASTLVADTGLNPSVVSAWLLSEESGGAAQSRQSTNNNDWLNVGYTDAGTDGAGDAVWSDPVSAANATAQWLKGADAIPGYGTASSGVQSILGTVGQSPDAQITALQSSGWSSSGYPGLGSLYAEVSA